MKNFLSSFLGSLAALVLFTGGVFLLFLGFLGILMAAGSKKAPVVESGSYLVFDLSANITDAPPLLDWSDLNDSSPSTLQLRSVVRAIRNASTDSRIKGVLLVGTLRPAGFGSGFAALREVRSALKSVTAAGKPVKAYIETVTTKDYYLASVASEVTMDPFGLIYMPGMASEPMYFAGAFQKYGIGVQVTRVGKYKSYVEPFTRTNMSPEDREQLQKLLNDIWGSLLTDISSSRATTVAKIQTLVDAKGLIRADDAKAAHLVDKVAYRDQVVDDLKAATGVTEPTEPFRQIGLAAYMKSLPRQNVTASAKVAIVYAEGDIVDGEGDNDQVGGAKYAKELRALRQDPSVKAIVLRVNSPGGSATASEVIQREIRLAKQVKPVIVSMGTYAASGGYWISAYSNKIFAEPTTVTGSIGVFGIQFDIQKLANDHGITFDSVKTGKFADSLTISRPKTQEELDVIQNIVDWEYDQFIAKVAEGRHLKPDFVREIAQGRVWSGSEAKKLGLVDELGSLADAVREAASEANLSTAYKVTEYPAKRDLREAIKDLVQKTANEGVFAHPTGVFGLVQSRFEAQLTTFKSFNDPQGIYAILPADLAIR